MNKKLNINNDSNISIAGWVGLTISLLITFWFQGFYDIFSAGYHSALVWLESSWNAETDYEHGWMVPLLCAFMVGHAWMNSREIPKAPSLQGLWLLALGVLLCVVSVRTQQGRVAVGALPIILLGLTWCYWGGKMARKLIFPLCFFWMSIPLPGFQQATVSLQLLATQAAHYGATLAGVETIMDGTNISSATGNWDTYSIAGGCSGIRSLMALLMISFAWAYLATGLSLWKRVLLALSAIPISIIGNGFRVASIFICAEYINPAFASKTWHDWSGLLFFFPASMLGLAILHGLLAGEIPFLKRRRVVVRRQQNSQNNSDSPSQP